MSIMVKGVKYELAEKVADEFDYSVFHIRHLARRGGKGDPKGLKAVKYKGKWYISLVDAQVKLTFGSQETEYTPDGEFPEQLETGKVSQHEDLDDIL